MHFGKSFLVAAPLSVAMVLTPGMVTAAFADSTYQVAGTGVDGLYLHPDSPTLDSDVTDIVPEGGDFDVECASTGDSVFGDTAWLYGTNSGTGHTGYVADYYVNTPVTVGTEIGQLADLGIPECGEDDTVSDTFEEQSETPAPYSCDGPTADSEMYDRHFACQWATHNVETAERFGEEDCTWFVSQALWEGGLPKTSEWTDYSADLWQVASKSVGNVPGPTKTAVKANTLIEYLVNNGLATKTEIDWSDNTAAGAQIGDIVAYHWNPVGPGEDPDTDYIDHLAIVTRFDGSYPEVSQHTPAQLNRGWSWSILSNGWLENTVRENDPLIVPRAWLIHIH